MVEDADLPDDYSFIFATMDPQQAQQAQQASRG
jgi:hypothetical protein